MMPPHPHPKYVGRMVRAAICLGLVLAVHTPRCLAQESAPTLTPDVSFDLTCDGAMTARERKFAAFLQEQGFRVLYEPRIPGLGEWVESNARLVALDSKHRVVELVAWDSPTRYSVTLLTPASIRRSAHLEDALSSFVKTQSRCTSEAIHRSTHRKNAEEVFAEHIRRIEQAFRQEEAGDAPLRPAR